MIHTKNLIVNQDEISYPNADCDLDCGCHQIHNQFEKLGIAGGEHAKGKLILLDDMYVVFVSSLPEMKGKGLVLAQRPQESNDLKWAALALIAQRETSGMLHCSFKTGRFKFTPIN